MILKSIRIVLVFTSAIIFMALSQPRSKFKIKTKKLINYIDVFLKNPEVRAFLDTISYAEGTFAQKNSINGYNILYAGHTFKKFDDHPRCVISSVAYKGIMSTAAGRYQILERTWDSIFADLDLTDFGPLNQDRAALGIIRQMGALQDVVAGRFNTAVQKLSSIWSSFPYATYGQSTKSLEELEQFYLARLKLYKKLN